MSGLKNEIRKEAHTRLMRSPWTTGAGILLALTTCVLLFMDRITSDSAEVLFLLAACLVGSRDPMKEYDKDPPA